MDISFRSVGNKQTRMAVYKTAVKFEPEPF